LGRGCRWINIWNVGGGQVGPGFFTEYFALTMGKREVMYIIGTFFFAAGHQRQPNKTKNTTQKTKQMSNKDLAKTGG
jgi:hypothetical protein